MDGFQIAITLLVAACCLFALVVIGVVLWPFFAIVLGLFQGLLF